MSGLAARQSAFLALILDEEQPLPKGWNRRQAAGIDIYRNNYRTALVEALLDTYPRTARWVGEESFRQAAAHHIIRHPPSSWTLDEAGRGFDVTLAELFGVDPEVGELGWVEWAMHQAFGAEDASPMTAQDFAAATAQFAESDWEGMRLSFMPRIATRVVEFDIAAIWKATAEAEFTQPDYALHEALACHVYRDGEQPVFITAPVYETRALTAMLADASFGDICALLANHFPEEQAAQEAGAMLARWLHNGMILEL